MQTSLVKIRWAEGPNLMITSADKPNGVSTSALKLQLPTAQSKLAS